MNSVNEMITFGDVVIRKTDYGVCFEGGWPHGKAFLDVLEEDRLAVARAILPDNYIVLRCGPNRFTGNSLVTDNTITSPIGIGWGDNDADAS